MTNQDLHELTSAYALDALDADDRRPRDAPRECERCRASSASWARPSARSPTRARGRRRPSRCATASSWPRARRGRRTSSRSGRADAPLRSRARRRCAAVGLAIGLNAASPADRRDKLAAWVVRRQGRRADDRHRPSGRAGGKAYEVWVINGKTPQAGRSLPRRREAGAHAHPPGAVGSTVAVTLERAGGVGRADHRRSSRRPSPPRLSPTSAWV